MAAIKLSVALASFITFAGFIFVCHVVNFSAFNGREASLRQGLEDCPVLYLKALNWYDL